MLLPVSMLQFPLSLQTHALQLRGTVAVCGWSSCCKARRWWQTQGCSTDAISFFFASDGRGPYKRDDPGGVKGSPECLMLCEWLLAAGMDRRYILMAALVVKQQSQLLLLHLLARVCTFLLDCTCNEVFCPWQDASAMHALQCIMCMVDVHAHSSGHAGSAQLPSVHQPLLHYHPAVLAFKTVIRACTAAGGKLGHSGEVHAVIHQ